MYVQKVKWNNDPSVQCVKRVNHLLTDFRLYFCRCFLVPMILIVVCCVGCKCGWFIFTLSMSEYNVGFIKEMDCIFCVVRFLVEMSRLPFLVVLSP